MRLDKVVLKFTQKSNWPRIAERLLKKGVGGVALENSKNYSKGTEFKTVWYQLKGRQVDQWDRRENLEADKPHVETQFMTKLGLQANGGRRFLKINNAGNNKKEY